MAESAKYSIRIRDAQANDARNIASLLKLAFSEYQSLYTPEAYSATILSPDGVLYRMAEGPVWVAIQQDAIVGTVSLVLRTGEVYIRGMAVDPAFHGKRISSTLLQHIEKYARANGYPKLTLCTTPFLEKAIRSYERYGFVRVNEGPPELFGTPLFTMIKELKH